MEQMLSILEDDLVGGGLAGGHVVKASSLTEIEGEAVVGVATTTDAFFLEGLTGLGGRSLFRFYTNVQGNKKGF